MVVVVAIHTQTVSHLYTGEKFFAFVGVKPKFKFKCSLEGSEEGGEWGRNNLKGAYGCKFLTACGHKEKVSGHF